MKFTFAWKSVLSVCSDDCLGADSHEDEVPVNFIY